MEPYRVDSEILALAKENCLFMHCMPAHPEKRSHKRCSMHHRPFFSIRRKTVFICKNPFFAKSRLRQEAQPSSLMKIILAYSGGLDTSVLVHWYANELNAEVITYSLRRWAREKNWTGWRKALSTGATAHRTLDLVDEFAEDFIYPMVRGNAVYESQYLLGTSIARPL